MGTGVKKKTILLLQKNPLQKNNMKVPRVFIWYLHTCEMWVQCSLFLSLPPNPHLPSLVIGPCCMFFASFGNAIIDKKAKGKSAKIDILCYLLFFPALNFFVSILAFPLISFILFRFLRTRILLECSSLHTRANVFVSVRFCLVWS